MSEHVGVNCDADVQANHLYTALIADAPTPPTVDLTGDEFSFTADLTSALYDDVPTVTLSELTDGHLDGDGVFDTLMASVDIHIQREFKGNRLTGDQYANVYLNSLTAVLGESVRFLLQKDKARWEALTAQMNGRIAEIKATEALILLEKTKVETQKAIFEMQNSGAEYAETKMKLAVLDVDYCYTKAQSETEAFKRNWLLPAELAIKQFQREELMVADLAIANVKHERVLPAQAAKDEFDTREIQPIERDTQQYNLDEVLRQQVEIAQFSIDYLLPINLAVEQHKQIFQVPAQTNLLNEQKEAIRAQTLDVRSDSLTPVTGVLGKQRDLLAEQSESERAKTLDTRSDAAAVVGSIGKQKDLYTQQIDSFVKDAQHKTAKMWLDAWITQKTLDESLTAPTQLVNQEVDEVLTIVRANNNLGS